MIFAPSVACTRPLYRAEDLEQLQEGGINFFHLDYMDGHRVPNLCMDFDTTHAIRKQFPDAILDGHLMVLNPEDYITPCAKAGLNYLSFIPETSQDPFAMIQKIHAADMEAGIVIDPEHSPEEYAPLLPFVEQVVVMSITPGGVRRPFEDRTYQKLDALVSLRKKLSATYLISVDGGINPDNGRLCRQHGADILILGYYAVFGQNISIPAACRRFRSVILEDKKHADTI